MPSVTRLPALPLRWNTLTAPGGDGCPCLLEGANPCPFCSLSAGLARQVRSDRETHFSGSSPHLVTLLTLWLKHQHSWWLSQVSHCFFWNSPWNTVKPPKELAEKSQRETDPSNGSLSGHLEEVPGNGEAERRPLVEYVRTVRSLWVWARHFRDY